MSRKKSERQYAIDNNLIMERWNFMKNQSLNLDPANITDGSHIRAHFICPKCKNEWYGEIRYVKRYNGGCSVCAEEKRRHSWMVDKLEKSVSLFESNPELEKEWDYEKNNNDGINPQMLVAGSSKSAHWICPLGHRYEALIVNRTRKNTGCTYCAGQAVLAGYNDLATTRPDLLVEWDYEENEKRLIRPQTVMRGSHIEASWICPVGHKYVKVIHARCQGQGCVTCAKESQTSFPEQVIFYYVSKIFPDAINRFGKPEIDIFIPSLNFGIEYDGEYAHKDRKQSEKKKNSIIEARGIYLLRVKETKKNQKDTDKVIYCKPNSNNRFLEEVLCKIQNIICSRYNIEIDFCADISRDRITIEEQYMFSVKKNSIVSYLPEVVKEWDYEKNGLINPEFVSHGSSHEYSWICSKGHSYIRSPKKRSLGYGCPICQDYRYLKGHNDFCTKYPQFISLWDTQKNDISPDAIKYTNADIYWWKCDKGHSYQTKISQIVKYGGCIVCAGRLTALVKGVNDLVTVFPGTAAEWDYEKNSSLPDDYFAKSNKSVFWKCNICGGSWESRIYKRTNCPHCKKVNVYDIQTAELVKIYDTIAELCDDLKIVYQKQHGNITMVCQRKQKTIKDRYVMRYRKDDEFYNLSKEERKKQIDIYING